MPVSLGSASLGRRILVVGVLTTPGRLRRWTRERRPPPSPPPGLTAVVGVRYDSDSRGRLPSGPLEHRPGDGLPHRSGPRFPRAAMSPDGCRHRMLVRLSPTAAATPLRARPSAGRFYASPAMTDYRISLTDFLSAAEALLLGTGESSPGTSGASSPSAPFRGGDAARPYVVLFRSAICASGTETTSTMTVERSMRSPWRSHPTRLRPRPRLHRRTRYG